MRGTAPIALGLALAACGAPRPAAPPTAPTAEVKTGDPLPAHPVETDTCKGGDRWLDSDPHVPLTLVDGDGFHSASSCCASWARRGDVWTAVDAWGAPAGEHAIAGGEGYDATECYEPDFGANVPALLVRGDAPWRAPASAAWTPDDAERTAAYRLGDAIDAVVARGTVGMVPGATPESPVAKRAVFFQMAPFAPDPKIAPTRFVAIGGRALVIAGLDAKGAWRVLYLDGSWGFGQPYVGDIYRVIGVFDMDHDGFPEVIIHQNMADTWDDLVLTCNHNSGARIWRRAAESVGGSTA